MPFKQDESELEEKNLFNLIVMYASLWFLQFVENPSKVELAVPEIYNHFSTAQNNKIQYKCHF